ncbi:hypothetical protein [Rhodopirellula sallentina]|uniref:Uncharacterized protein n=1 Tax=Rhodopirellula sallentina SM41 TaxID=1263870 RepID=M5TTZ7_9BACT|nr:hypothetical protein [Rhodopirellula sallentina]EMI52534.1 hypothetical protein RSSM_06028 [Rhodopirellula sallentina SM41]
MCKEDFDIPDEFSLADLERASHRICRRQKNMFDGPAWRFQNACRIVQNGVPTAIEYDETVWLTVRHLSNNLICPPPDSCGRRRIDFASLSKIYNDLMRRLEIESRLLARIPIDEVARIMGIDVVDVRDYCAVYFDVLESLDAIWWILDFVINPVDAPPDYLRSMVYRFSYKGGGQICEYLLDHVSQLEEECDVDSPVWRQRERIKLLILFEQCCDKDPQEILTTALRSGYFSELPHADTVATRDSVVTSVWSNINAELGDCELRSSVDRDPSIDDDRKRRA